MSVQIPHFDLPFRYGLGVVAVNEQDSVNDVAACVYAVLVTEPGTRDEMPDFGYSDPTFTQQPLSPQVIAAQIAEWEPRGEILVDAAPNVLDPSVAIADIQVGVTS